MRGMEYSGICVMGMLGAALSFLGLAVMRRGRGRRGVDGDVDAGTGRAGRVDYKVSRRAEPFFWTGHDDGAQELGGDDPTNPAAG